MAGKKVKFVNAIMIGLFDKAEGWILEDWPECESIEVSYWMEMPELPDELKISDVNLKTDHRLVGGVV